VDLNRGVFLDLGSVDNGDLDRGRLSRSLPEWHWHDHTALEECAGRVGDASVVISNKCLLDRRALSAAAGLKLVVSAATGTNHIDLQAAADLDITVCNSRDYATAAVSQHVITMMLNLLSSQPAYVAQVRNGDWSEARHFSLFDLPIRQAAGLSLGIIGYGVLGKSVAALGRKLGMNVLIAERRGGKPRGDHLRFEDVVAHADVISIHCPLTDDTRGLFDRAMMQRMKRDAILINTARGGIVVEEDLVSCLQDGIIAGAGIDVLTEEPPARDHPLLAGGIPNLIVTPHNAWASRTARQALLDQLAGIIRAFEKGLPINRVV
jgi:glycerate dehydrogenase